MFLTLNASVNHHSKDTLYLKELAKQLTNKTETKLKGTSRLIIWDRIVSDDIIFEGKGLVLDNDLFTVSGRANQILQNLTGKNFGYVTMQSATKELEALKNKWLDFLSNKPVQDFVPEEFKNAKIPETASLMAVNALVVSLQENPLKDAITKNCLQKVYHLDAMPADKKSSAYLCNPDSYTFTYLGLLFGDEKIDETKDATWWKKFWDDNHANFAWNAEKGIYEVKK